MKKKRRSADAELRAVAEDKACAVQKGIAYLDGFLAEHMCGRCFPCALGTYEVKVRLNNLCQGRGTRDDLAAIGKIAETMQWGSLCKKGRNTARYLFECLETGEFDVHMEDRCPSRVCEALVEYRILPDRCTMCGQCKAVCEYNAILGTEKKGPHETGHLPFEIRQKRCAKTGACLAVCPEEAIVVIDKSKERMADLAA